MSAPLLRLLLSALAVLLASPAFAAGPLLRYALVVGNNHGHSPDGPLPPLRHAEREAEELRETLVRFGNFDREGTIVVTGAGREEILRQARILAERHRKARRQLGEASSLFAFFFTGHGLSGKLLTADEPLDGADLVGLFREMDATLSVGLFDACFAGSLDLESLRAKGVIATPGFNPVAELPDELLNAEGSLWFVSSRPTEQSFEDSRLGGLFTHFFIESFTAVPPDTLGVSLDAMWEYTRSRTSAVAAKHGRMQTPVKIVRHLKAEGPVYFSFPRERTARLRFASDVEGTFLVQYQQGAMAERVVKRPGRPLDVALFSGNVRLSRVESETSAPTAEFQIADGQQVVIRTADVERARTAPGFRESPIQLKGELPGMTLGKQHGSEWHLVAGYGAAPVSENLMSADRYGTLGVYVARGMLALGAEGSWGQRSREFEAWKYSGTELGVRLSAGLGMAFSRSRLDLEVLAGPTWLQTRYGTGEIRETLGAWAGAGLRFSTSVEIGAVTLSPFLRASAGMKWSRGIAASAVSPASAFQPAAQFGVALRLPQ